MRVRFTAIRYVLRFTFYVLLPSAHAWGPHPEITQAALDALGTNNALIQRLGPQAQRLTNYAWMADYRNLIFEEPDQVFYANDYLLFPEATQHWDHICPEVKKTYRPYFMRAVQALRTETPANAARWIGSLLHFVEDTGSPPHAAEIRGAIHSRMENWVDARKIHIRGHRPQSLGNTEEEALKGLLRRLDEIIDFSKARARKIRLAAEIGNRAEVEPGVLESALETSRLTADLLHTFGALGTAMPNAGVLEGTVASRDPVGTESFPAKIILEETSYSTMADPAGRFQFRNLPAGKYRLAAFRPGNGFVRQNCEVAVGKTNIVDVSLPAAPANLIRNGDFQLRWVQSGAPDCWFPTRVTWEGEVIPLKSGQRYRLTAKFRPGTQGEVVARWAKPVRHALPRFAEMPRFENRSLTPQTGEWIFTADERLGLLQLSIQTSGRKPETLLERISLEALPSTNSTLQGNPSAR